MPASSAIIDLAYIISRKEEAQSIGAVFAGDRPGIPDHLALLYTRDMAASGDTKVTIRVEDLDLPRDMAPLVEGGGFPDGFSLAYSEFEISVAPEALAFEKTDQAADIERPGDADMARVIGHVISSVRRTVVSKVCALASTNPHQYQAPAVPVMSDLWLMAQLRRTVRLESPGVGIGFLHPEQVRQLSYDAAFRDAKGNFDKSPDVAAWAKVREGGYLGRIEGIDWFENSAVEIADGMYQAPVFYPGGVAIGRLTPAALKDAVVLTFPGTNMAVRVREDVRETKRKTVWDVYAGAGRLLPTHAHVFRSPAA